MAKFKALLRVLDALPNKLPDDRPLREVMPGAWPTVGDPFEDAREEMSNMVL